MVNYVVFPLLFEKNQFPQIFPPWTRKMKNNRVLNRNVSLMCSQKGFWDSKLWACECVGILDALSPIFPSTSKVKKDSIFSY